MSAQVISDSEIQFLFFFGLLVSVFGYCFFNRGWEIQQVFKAVYMTLLLVHIYCYVNGNKNLCMKEILYCVYICKRSKKV
jgi:hypothetical protein